MSRWLKLDDELFNDATSNSIQIVDDQGVASLIIKIKLNSDDVPDDDDVPPAQQEENKLLYRETIPGEMFTVRKASIMIHRTGTNPKGRSSRLVITANISPKVPHTGGALAPPGDEVESLEFSK